MNTENKSTILIAPLDWGWGHVTRIIPLAFWLKKNYNVIVAAPQSHHFLLHNKGIPCVELNGYNIRYFNIPVWMSLLIQTPKILKTIVTTKIKTQKLIKKYQPLFIISDNRPFFRHNKVKSIYITHQLNIPHSYSLIKYLLNKVHHYFISKFDTCWVPDTEKHIFAGELSKNNLKIPVHFIGGLSRFLLAKTINCKKFNIVCILSGPEPLRSRWAKAVEEKIKNEHNSLIIGSLNGFDVFEKRGNITLASHLNDNLFLSILQTANYIVARSGYSTIMDLFFVQKGGSIIPTPGQGEQEYLANYHDGNYLKKIFTIDQISQKTKQDTQTDIYQKFCSKNRLNKLIEKVNILP